MPSNEAQVYFALDGDDFDPEEVTQIIGCVPSKTFRKGDPHGRVSHKSSSWQMSTDTTIDTVDECLDIHRLGDILLAQPLPARDGILRAIDAIDLKARLEVVVWFTGDERRSMPIFGFSKEMIAFLSKVGASIDIDSYRQ